MGDSISTRHEFLSWPLAEATNDLAVEDGEFYARRYGAEKSDLDLDYHLERSDLITRLLKACVRNLKGEHYSLSETMGWSLKRRLQALIAVGIATHGSKMELQAQCADDNCRQVLELTINLQDFSESEDETHITCQPSGDAVIELRLPTGADQVHWLNQNRNDDREELFTGLATSLIISINGTSPEPDWQVPPEWLDSISQSLESHDLLMTMQINSECPACGATVAVELDLEAQLLSLFSIEQETLLQHIHRLASAYHWAEQEILSLPAKRRHYYLSKLEEDALA